MESKKKKLEKLKKQNKDDSMVTNNPFMKTKEFCNDSAINNAMNERVYF